jgi:hypothetical protein
VPHSETHGFDDADNSRDTYARCHELLAECCAVITQNGGVARSSPRRTGRSSATFR